MQVTKRYSLRAFLSLVLGLALPLSAGATSKLFKSDEPINAVLSAPISSIYKQKKAKIRLYQPGELSYKVGDNEPAKVPVTVKTRGNFRRLNCYHPPLRLNFSAKKSKKTLFKGQDKLKLVGPCETGMQYREFIGLEYLSYKIWEILSPYHFKTRLINMSYIDTDKAKKPWSRTTFIIEALEDVAKRTKRVQLRDSKVARTSMNMEHTALVEMFQLLIANTDYSTVLTAPPDPCCHNARLLVNKGSKTDIIAVPYDFDVSGFVSTPYASPAAQYPIKKVRQRYFSGWCKRPEHFENAAKHVISKKDDIYALLNGTKVISDKSKKNTIKYVDKYFKILETPAKFNTQVLKRCRGKLIEG